MSWSGSRGSRSRLREDVQRDPPQRAARGAGRGKQWFALLVSKCLAVALWRKCDTLPLWDKRCATPGWVTNATGAGTTRPRRARVSAVRGKAKGGWRPFPDVWHGLVLGLKDMQRSVRTRESAQDLSWLCSLPCGNSGGRRPAAVSVAFLGALPGDTGVRRAPCARVEPGAYLIGEPERRGSDGPWGERARSGSLTDRLRRATVEVTAGLLQAHGKVLTPAFPDCLWR